MKVKRNDHFTKKENNMSQIKITKTETKDLYGNWTGCIFKVYVSNDIYSEHFDYIGIVYESDAFKDMENGESIIYNFSHFQKENI